MHEMRRKDRRIPEEEALELLKRCEYAVLATVDAKDGSPYCVPVSPVYSGGCLYFHCARRGQKNDNIQNDARVCLTCVGATKLLPEEFSTKYESVVVYGKAEFLTDKTEQIEALRKLCEKYASSNMDAFDGELAKSLGRTAVCRIQIEEISGKAKR